VSNIQCISYRTSRFKRRFVRYSHNFDINVIERKSSGANFIMEVLMTEPYLCNPELNCSKCITMFSTLCLKSLSHVKTIDSFVPEKIDDLSLIMLHPIDTLRTFSSAKCDNNCAISRILKNAFTHYTVRRVHTLEITFREKQGPVQSA
jgi:hypothetical protein